MEANYIEDYQISATSSWKYEHKPYYGRLHSHSSWIPDTEATHSLEVDFLHTTMLTGFIMQGGFMVDNFVTGFIISLGRGDGNFMPYQENGHEKVKTYTFYLFIKKPKTISGTTYMNISLLSIANLAFRLATNLTVPKATAEVTNLSS